MIDLKLAVQNPEAVENSLQRRNRADLVQVLQAMVADDEARRKKIMEVENLKADRNKGSEQIAVLKKQKQDASAILESMKAISQKIKELDEQVAETQKVLEQRLLELPNVLHESVPTGKGAEDNKEVRRWGTIPQFDFKPKTHDEMGEIGNLLDFKKAGEVTGARFVFAKGVAAKLERALINFMLDTHSKHGYEEILPPFLVNRNTLFGTGQLPKFEEDVFRIEKFDYFLIPTAEVPVTNFHREEILDEAVLTKKYCAYTPCFRSEAGSYGKDTKGLKRQHQFNKVELVKFAAPEKAEAELEALLADAERILQLLKLPYRVVLLCGGDTGFGSAKTYDLEVWSPGSNGYMEISSCSMFSDYQARRASIRYRRSADKKVAFLNTLNGSGLAVGRTLIAIMENFQKADGSFDIPAVLQPYLERMG
jgi:seryl-tRNA synthetase